MSTSQQRSRKQIRQSVGVLTGKIWQDAGALESSPTETAPSAGKIIDQNLAFGFQNEHRSKWLWATDSNSSVESRRILASDPSERSVNVTVPFSRTPDSGWTYEMWDAELSPTIIHELINQVITEVDRKGATPFTSDSFHTGGGVRAWGLSSDFAGARFVEWRRSFTGQQFVSFDNAMSTLISQVTSVTDSQDVKEGSGATKLTIGTGASNGFSLAQSTFAVTNLSGYTHVDVWMKSNVTLNSSNLQVRLLEGSTATEILGVQALNADSWTRVNFALNSPEKDSAITTFRLTTGSSWADTNSATIFLDDAISYRQKAEEWVTIPRDFWSIDKDRRELRISPDARVPYAKLQVTGVKKPTLLTSDSQISDVDPQYIVNAVSAKAFRMMGDDGSADRYEALAQQQRNRMTTPSGIKWADN